MLELEKITEAIINITIGNINKTHDDFHDRVRINIVENEILISGHKLECKKIYGHVTELNKEFEIYRKKLIGFEEDIIESKFLSWYECLTISEFKKIFSWKKLRFNKFKMIKNGYYTTKYIYKPEFWTQKEYRANNWVIT